MKHVFVPLILAATLSVCGAETFLKEVAGLNATLDASMLALSSSLASRSGGDGTAYTRNAICKPRFCINPVFPGLMYFQENFLTLQSQKTWTCVDNSQVWRLAGFCERVVVGYPFALPNPESGEAQTVGELIPQQAKAALMTYVAHLSGMGFDLWDHQEPWNADDCIQAVWKMSCYTHFPRCNEINPTEYLRPCASSCRNYVSQCAVECCDEGTRCVFTHSRELADGTVQRDSGYVDHAGPSPLCTGAAPSRRSGSLAIFSALLGLAALGA